jgi:ribonucleotide monophosphatase NagD (HAD superfamily)
VPAAASDVVTSAQAVARLIAEAVPAGSKVLAVGGEGLIAALRERGLVPVGSADDDPAAAVQGYDPELRWSQLAEMAHAINRGVPWYASNGDLTIPRGDGIVPGNGAAVEAVRYAVGGRSPVMAGKPLPPMHRETVLRTGAKRPLVVGDRLDTDIEGAYAGGVDALLVLTGVTTPAMLLAAEPRHRPTYVGRDLRDLLAPQPEVAAVDGGFRCGGWTARAAGGALSAEGEGDAVDGLRALCAAAWTRAGSGTCAVDAAEALRTVGL